MRRQKGIVMSRFCNDVYKLTLQIPRGMISTYGAIARAMGKRNAYRAVGMALRINPDIPNIPCHRVVNSNGKIGGYANGLDEKTYILREEGIRVTDMRVRDFSKRLFTKFEK